MSIVRVGAVARQRVAGGVDADRLDEVVDGHDGAGALGHPQRLAVLEQVDHLADQDLEVLARGVAEGGAHRHHPADVAVVVGAEHDEAAVEAALALVEVVGQVAGEVGPLAVGLDDHPVLVVAELLGAQPERAVLLVGVAQLGEPLDGALDGADSVQVVLVEVDVEVDAEVVQALLDLGEHQLDAARRGRPPGPRRPAGRGHRAGLARTALAISSMYCAAVAVLRHRLALGRWPAASRLNRSIWAPWSLK